MHSKPRIRNLSTRFLKIYKLGGLIILLGMIGFLFVNGIITYLRKGYLYDLFSPFYFSYLIYLWIKVNRGIVHVEFDEEFLYVILKDHDLLIPLENIKDVNLISLGGVYKVDLYSKEEIGQRFYFKPSLLYPFNHKKKEAVVDILWSNIEKAKRKKQDFQRNALHS